MRRAWLVLGRPGTGDGVGGGDVAFADVLRGQPLAMMGMLAVMSLLPFAVVMLTSFSKIAVVLSIARRRWGRSRRRRRSCSPGWRRC